MVRNESKKSLAQAKTPTRRQPILAARPASAAPEPRVLHDGQPKSPAGDGEPLRQNVEGGKAATAQPFVVHMFHARDDALLLSAQSQSRTRRPYEEHERLQVADTRRRGACKSCQASKTKCFHDPSKTTTDKYQTESQSHELFALGLTTSSQTANEDGHKQVMEEKMAALVDKLPNAQKTPSEQDAGANSDGRAKTAPLVTPSLPPKATITKAPSSQKRSYPTEVHQVQTRQTLSFQHCMKTLKLNDGGKQKNASPRQPKNDGSKVPVTTALGKKKPNSRMASGSRHPIVCQQRPIRSLSSAAATIEPADRIFTPRRSNLFKNGAAYDLTNSRNIYLHDTSSQKSTTDSSLTTLNTTILKPRLESVTTRTLSECSDHDDRITTIDGSMLSFGRSPTPSSDHLPSNPPSFVQLMDLERTKSHDQAMTQSENRGHEKDFSFENFLYCDDSMSLVDDDTDLSPPSERGNLDSIDSPSRMELSEPLFTSSTDIDLDDI